MTTDELISKFELMRDEHWAYSWTGSEYGNVGCSGAFVHALGKKLIKEKSSNWMARNAVEELFPISEVKPGMVLFKRREQGADTPERWKDGKGDFYHTGLAGRDGKTALHASSPTAGFIESPINKQWTHCGWLKGVTRTDIAFDSGKGFAMNANATVNVETTLNVRRGTATSYDVIGELMAGERVEVTDDLGDWLHILYQDGRKSGYVASRYIKMDEVIEEKEETTYTTLMNVKTGQCIMLVDEWRIVND